MAAEPALASSASHAQAVAATASKIIAIDHPRQAGKNNSAKRRQQPLRQPGAGVQQAPLDADKDKFVQPIIDIMADARVGRGSNASASAADYQP